jgi:hypothetical protein
MNRVSVGVPVFLAVFGIMAIAGCASATPTSTLQLPTIVVTATNTIVPTSTSLPTSTPSLTPLPTLLPPTPTPPLSPTPTATLTLIPVPTQMPAAPGARITGSVIWNAVPVPNARIELRQSIENPSAPALAQTVASTDGRFALENVPTGTYWLLAMWPNDNAGGAAVQVTAVAGKSVELEFPLGLTKKLQILEPATGTTVNTTPTLRWDSFPGADSYQVFVGNEATGEPILQQTTPDTSVAIKSPLAKGQYYWAVHAIAGNARLASATSWFIVQP